MTRVVLSEGVFAPILLRSGLSVLVHMGLLLSVDQFRIVIYLFCLPEYTKLALFGSQG
jgi:hypothetical protein